MPNCRHLNLTRRLHPDLLVWEAVLECIDCRQWRPIKLKATYGPWKVPKNASVGAIAPPTRLEEQDSHTEPLPEEEPDGIASEPMESRRTERIPSPPRTPPAHPDQPPTRVAKEFRCPACTHKVYDNDLFKTNEMLKEKMICKACAVAFPQLIHPSETERLATLRSSLGLPHRVG